MIPLSILRVKLQISSLNNLPAETVIVLAAGNAAKIYGLNTGKIEEGRKADHLAFSDGLPDGFGREKCSRGY